MNSPRRAAPGAAIRQGDFKLIHFYEDDRVELYNLREDLGETRNLARRQPAKARDLRQKLDRWRQQVAAVVPRQNPAYDAATADQGLAGAERPTAPVE